MNFSQNNNVSYPNFCLDFNIFKEYKGNFHNELTICLFAIKTSVQFTLNTPPYIHKLGSIEPNKVSVTVQRQGDSSEVQTFV